MGGKFGVRISLPRIFSTKLLDGYQDNLDLFDACQRSKSAPNMKNLRPIWTMRMRSSSMILRKCRTEKPASSAALGMSRNVLFVRSEERRVGKKCRGRRCMETCKKKEK